MKRLVLFIALALSVPAIAQRANLTEGDVSFLKGIKRINVTYDYSNMEVGKKTEKEYIADKKEAYNGKEPGRGDKWEKSWVGDRKARFEPRFEEEFNKHSDLQVSYAPGEKYTLILKTTFTEPGFNVGAWRKNAYIDCEAWIVETANKDKVLAKIEINNCPGRVIFGMDYDTGERIQEAYAMAGKGLAKFFSRNVE